MTIITKKSKHKDTPCYSNKFNNSFNSNNINISNINNNNNSPIESNDNTRADIRSET